jgi:hypothetical protein
MTDDQPIPPTPQTEKDSHNDAANPDSNTVPEVKIPPSHKCYAVTHKTQRDKWDVAKLVAEFVGLGFLIIYTLYTAGIYRANRDAAKATQDTFGQIQQQTTLMRQQLVGTQSAVVIFNGNGPTTEPYPIKAKKFNVNVGLKNDGHVVANSVEIRYTVQVLHIADDGRTGKQWPCGKVMGVLPPSTPNRPADYLQCFVEISDEDFRDIIDRKSTLAVEGNYVYDNGFGESKTQPFCLRYVQPITTKKYGLEGAGQLLGCDDFPRWFAMLNQHLAEDQP